MLNDTLTTLEDRFFDGLQSAQEPAIAVGRRTAAALGTLPVAGDLAVRNLSFARRLLEVQQAFVAELAGAASGTGRADKERSGD